MEIIKMLKWLYKMLWEYLYTFGELPDPANPFKNRQSDLDLIKSLAQEIYSWAMADIEFERTKRSPGLLQAINTFDRATYIANFFGMKVSDSFRDYLTKDQVEEIGNWC